MLDLFVHAPATQRDVPVLDLATIKRLGESDSLTGILEINCTPDARLTLLFVQGEISSAYWLTAADCKPISPDHLTELLPSELATVRILSLPAEGLHAAKSLLDWLPPVEVMPVEASTIARHLGAWAARPTAGIVHILWPDAEGFVSLPGGSLPNSALFVTDEQIKSDAAGREAIYTHPGQSCTLAYYEMRAAVSHLQQDQITHLRTAFALLVESVVVRYAGVLGQNMAVSLMSDLSGTAKVNGWNITGTIDGIADTHPFETIDAAARAYTVLVEKMIEHMSTVIGVRLAGVFVFDRLNQLDPQSQQALRTHCTGPLMAASISKR